MVRFVGRTAELDQLHAQYAAVVTAGLRCVFLEGAAGIGKTTLLDRFLTDLAAANQQTSHQTSHQASLAGSRPAGRQPSRSRRPASIVRVEAAESARTHELDLAHRLIDALADGSPGAHPPARRGDADDDDAVLDVDRVRDTGDELVDAMTRTCGRGPVVVRVDDVHWCDASSLRVLSYLVLHAARLPVLLLLAGRPHDSPWVDGVRRLAASGGATVDLSGFDVAELAALCAAAGVEPPPPRRLRALVDGTDGNPLWLTRLIAPGTGATAGSGWDGVQDPASQVAMGTPPAPEPLTALVARDLRACPPAGRRLAAAVAVLGESVPLADVATLAGVEDAAQALDEALAGDLVSAGGWPPRVAPSHALVRAAIYHELDVVERTTLHLAAAAASPDRATALEHRAAAAIGSDDTLAAELAACAAAESAAGLFARAGDHRLLAAALTADPAAVRTLRLDAAMSFMQAGERADAEAALAAVGTGTDTDTDEDEDTSPRRLYVQAHLDMLANRGLEAVLGFMGSWEAAQAAGDAETAAQCGVWLAQALIPAGYYDDAATWARRAADESTAPLAIQATGLGMYATALVAATGDRGRALAELSAGEQRMDQAALRGALRIARGVVGLWSGDLPGALAELVPASWAGVDFLHGRLIAAAHHTEAAFRAGRWDESDASGREVVALAEASGHRWVLPFVYPIAALVPAARGDVAAAGPLLARAAEYLPLDLAAMRAYYGTAAAHLAAALDDPAGVVAAYEPVRALSNPAGALAPSVFDWRDLYIEALVKLRRLDDAERELDQFEADARARASPDGSAQALRARGTLLIARGRLDEAIVALDDAASRADQLGMRLPAALARMRAAEVHRRRRRTPRAHEALTAAIATLDELGAATYARRCRDQRDALRRQAPGRAAPRPTAEATGPAASRAVLGRDPGGRRQGPTERELALLARILRGDDFEAIARDMYMSRGHAENVARELYRMHGVTSRTELAGIYLGLRDPGGFPVHPLPALPARDDQAEGARPTPPPGDGPDGPTSR